MSIYIYQTTTEYARRRTKGGRVTIKEKENEEGQEKKAKTNKKDQI